MNERRAIRRRDIHVSSALRRLPRGGAIATQRRRLALTTRRADLRATVLPAVERRRAPAARLTVERLAPEARLVFTARLAETAVLADARFLEALLFAAALARTDGRRLELARRAVAFAFFELPLAGALATADLACFAVLATFAGFTALVS